MGPALAGGSGKSRSSSLCTWGGAGAEPREGEEDQLLETSLWHERLNICHKTQWELGHVTPTSWVKIHEHEENQNTLRPNTIYQPTYFLVDCCDWG